MLPKIRCVRSCVCLLKPFGAFGHKFRQALDMTIPDGPERPAPEARYPRTILIARVLLSHMRQLRAGATLSEALLELGSARP